MKKLHLANVSGRFIFTSDNADESLLKEDVIEILMQSDCFCLSSNVKDINSLDAVPLDLRDKAFVNLSSGVVDDEEDILTNMTPREFFGKHKFLEFLKSKLSEEDFETAKGLL